MKITIIGAGISGLTTALALKKLGIDSEVFEKASQLNEVGAGISIQPNAIKVLDWLGLGKSVRENGILLNKAEIADSQLKPIKQTASNIFEDETTNKAVAIHRGRLQKLLYEALPDGTVKLGESFENLQTGKTLEVHFKNSSFKTDLLIGADGIHSKVRQQIFTNTSLRYSGQTCWRGISESLVPAPLQNIAMECWGNKVRFGFSQVARDKVYWYAVVNASANGKHEPDTVKADLSEIFKDFHPLVPEFIKATDAGKIIRSDIYDLQRLEHWHHGNVLLIGDAAHATTPNMGQGACQGIEDAYYFSNLFAKHRDIQHTFKTFEM